MRATLQVFQILMLFAAIALEWLGGWDKAAVALLWIVLIDRRLDRK